VLPDGEFKTTSWLSRLGLVLQASAIQNAIEHDHIEIAIEGVSLMKAEIRAVLLDSYPNKEEDKLSNSEALEELSRIEEGLK
jgi:hypothetical protein